jgi:hypothetical protein
MIELFDWFFFETTGIGQNLSLFFLLPINFISSFSQLENLSSRGFIFLFLFFVCQRSY